MTWTHGDNILAEREGWAIFDANGEPQLQRDEEAARFDSDEAAWAHVWLKALQGSELHARAINHLRTYSPREYRRISYHIAH